jgi:hypothetical protein
LSRLFEAKLRGNQVVPQVSSNGRAEAKILLNEAGNQIQVFLSFFNLTSSQTTATINGPALPGTNAPAVFNLGTVGGTSGFFPTRTFTVTPLQAEQLRTGLLYVVLGSANNPNGELRGQVRTESQCSDFSGDGMSDISVYRPNNQTWYSLDSTSGAFSAKVFGQQTDKIVPGDFDGDGINDLVVYHPGTTANPNQGVWEIKRSSDNGITTVPWGLSSDIPVRGDFDGDGRNDVAVFRPSTGVWYVLKSTDGSFLIAQFGAAEDKPVAADYDGDGRDDIAVWRPSNGVWYVYKSSDNGFLFIPWGAQGDLPMVGDYDGDGQNDQAVFRPTTGVWYIRRSIDGSMRAFQFGTQGDIPAAGNFDDDYNTDVAIFRPDTGTWYILRSSDSTFTATRFGINGDIPTTAP